MKRILSLFMLTGLVSCGKGQKSSPITASDNAIIVDVRTPEEWNSGHADCSVNYPLANFEKQIDSLKKYDKVILVCRSGQRARTAKKMLESAGIKNVDNLGAWENITCQ
jgi:phage shock protein E